MRGLTSVLDGGFSTVLAEAWERQADRVQGCKVEGRLGAVVELSV